MSELVVGETVFADESLSDYEALHAFFQVADERGHASPSVVVDEFGRVVSHPDYVDRMGVPHLRAGAWAFCRRPAAEALGLPSGTDWVRDHALSLMFYEGSPYRSVPHFYPQLYIQEFGSTQPRPMMPMCSAHPVAWSADGSRLCVMEERLGQVTDGTTVAKYVIWEYELTLGKRRRIAGFPNTIRLDLVELSYSPDGQWIHLCDWSLGRNLLIHCTDGLLIRLPFISPAASWNPRAGSSAMVVMSTNPDTGSLIVTDYDLHADNLTKRAEIRSLTGLPLAVRELSMSLDERAAVIAPVGVAGVDQLRRAGVQAAAVIDIDGRTIESILPIGFRTDGIQRRHTSPRWCDDRAAMRTTPTLIADHLLESGRPDGCAPDKPEIATDHLQRWLEILDEIHAAWHAGTMPTHRFAQEFAQHAISCFEADPVAATPLLNRLREFASRDATARKVVAWIRTGHRMWAPLSEPAQPADSGQPDSSLTVEAITTEEYTSAALNVLIAAESVAQIGPAVRQLLDISRRQEQNPKPFWAWLAAFTTQALGRGSYEFVAKVAMTTQLWNGVVLGQTPSIARLGIVATGPDEALSLMTDGFEACTHLPERLILGGNDNQIYDVEDVRSWCQLALSQLPLTDYLRSTARPTRPQSTPPTAPIPTADRSYNSGNSPVKKSVFISYLRENSTAADRIAAGLRAAGVDVWIDRDSLAPAQDWRYAIRRAIREGAFFVACFSAAYADRDRTYMNEELRLAVNELRMMAPGRQWFIPALLEPCEVPELLVDAVTSLKDLQYLDFTHDWNAAMAKLIGVVTNTPPAAN